MSSSLARDAMTKLIVIKTAIYVKLSNFRILELSNYQEIYILQGFSKHFSCSLMKNRKRVQFFNPHMKSLSIGYLARNASIPSLKPDLH